MAVGQEVVCFCSSCKLELRHVIVAHKSGNSGPIAKVRCNTCNKIHSYRSTPAGGMEKKVSVRAAPKQKAQVVPVEVEWREQLSKHEGTPSVAYFPSGEFKQGDVIDHPTFGSGVVRSLKDANKLEVVFQRDIKMLVHKLKTE